MKPGRIKPPMGHDNAWWWQQAAEDKLAIQRCSGCQVLRHPPRPMCDRCRSMEWDFIIAKGEAKVISFTVLHHPKFPGYSYPLPIVLAELAEGTRYIAELIDCDVERITRGMRLQVTTQTDDDGFKIPVFRPATGSE
ncbi:Zn-ribbon domain-containing OB-fold protein [Sinobacterium caligoides]|uniref:Zn-ribbon domain-containing OB-fold protein n=1 Tax=Sinobacterium caligoides TaxID=933926 RepID=UPI0013C33F9C|nr:OB-fold domain-containing protein [Sinobacterium caligoides]